MKKYILLFILLSVYGCATSSRINKISLGMTKPQVIEAMGKPVSVSAQQGAEYLNYKLSETSDDAFNGVTTPYYVRFVDDKVESYGRLGDFDSTKTPTVRIEKDENITGDADININSKGDMYSELMKLKELKEDGIINEDEFNQEKKELLEKY